MKKTSFILLASIIFFSAMCINEEQALLVTQNFLKERNIGKDSPLSKISVQEIVKKDDIPTFYIMNLGDKEGFVIISASEYVSPIVGYSFDSEFGWHPAIQYYLDSYSDFILFEQTSKQIPDNLVTKKWNRYLQVQFVPQDTIVNEVLPLITSHWNQNKFYNTYCPWDIRAGSGYDYRVPNGCVALATAQLMNYYRHPETGRMGVSYKPDNYSTQTVFFSQHQYHWDAMTNNATNYTNEIAKLAYHVGVAVQMGYAPSGSGAYTEKAAEALNENFFYTKTYSSSGSDYYAFKKEIDGLRPILMSGDNGNSGHAFLVDGYIETVADDCYEIIFHFNWGWGGAADAYYTLENQPFFYNATAFLNIQPQNNYPVQCQQYKRQTAYQGYVTNGSTNKPYESNPDCSWIIAAPLATKYNFSFSRLDTQEDVDKVTIYNGSAKSAGIAATFSGTATPTQTTTVIADSVLITFTSNDPTFENESHLGFLMNYTTDKPQQKCDNQTYLTNSSGYITDGTEIDENYTPWSSCTWNISPINNTGFYGLFYEFDLKLGDFVDVYDATKSPPYFWRRFDRYTPPNIGEIFNIPFSKIQIQFISDNFEEGNGFKFQYFSLLGIDDKSLLDNFTVFPNPAYDFINISFSSELENQNIKCSLVDVTGKEVYFSNIEYKGDVFTTQIPVAHLAKGLYFLQLITKNGKTTSKIIVD